MRDKKGNIKKITEKYITELSNMKYVQLCMTSFELDFRRFERQPQSEKLSIIFTPSMEIIFETIETVYIEMNLPHSIFEPIVNRKI